jgi:hypothetical protein
MSHKLSSRPGKEFAVDLEFTHDGFQPLLAGGSGHIAKCSFAIFLDEPQPGNAIVYVELVTCGTRQVGLRFHDHVDANTIEADQDFYRDDPICEQLLGGFRRLDSESHTQNLSSDPGARIREVTGELIPGGGSNQDAYTRDLVRMPESEDYQGTWLRWSWEGRAPIIGHSPVRVKCRVRSNGVAVKDLYFWVFLPRDYVHFGEEFVVRDGTGPLARSVGRPNPVESGLIGSDYPVFNAWKSLAANKEVVHLKDAIELTPNHIALFAFDCVSDKLSARARREAFYAGVLVSLSANIATNVAFYGATGQLKIWINLIFFGAAALLFIFARRKFLE